MLTGTFGTSVEDRVRMCSTNAKTLVKGKKTYEVVFDRYDPLFDRVHEMLTLPTQDKAQATAQFNKRKSNPHYKNVRMIEYIY